LSECPADGRDKKGLPEILPSEMEKHQSIKLLWDAVNDKLIQGYNLSFLPIRAYSNAHTYGLDGAPHTDDGEVTAIYYPVQDRTCRDSNIPEF